ncbi:hypothetical protein [Plantibacter sp. CFBP 8775]|uniref:hypothetical protein n=1 Tax=Plantibacter sp. CFBP 8775 TaxID=2774038 RepID=UPI0017837C5F|nr:hypothetical protein [Plantibacter sp. CFBP 8775]MBD8103188.1 hypothetical protein [Plantibacter sp. CFBP 8775]
MNEHTASQPTDPTQPTAATERIEPVERVEATDHTAIPATPATTGKPAFWRRKPVWITAIVVGALALGGAGAAYAVDEFGDDDDDRVTAASNTDRDGGAAIDDGDTTAATDDRDARDADDVPLTDTEFDAASKAALAEAKGGTVTDVDRSDDPGEAFEVDVLLENGDELEVALDADYAVVTSVLDPRD